MDIKSATRLSSPVFLMKNLNASSRAVAGKDVYKRQFMGFLCLFFYNTDYIQGIVSSLGVSNPVVFVAAFVGVQGLIEAGFCFVVGSIVSKALSVALKRA